MPFDPISFGLSALPGVAKGLVGLLQRNEDVKRVDTTPAAFKEQLALERQRAAGSMPDYAALVNGLGRGQAGAVQAARLGAASSGDYLAAAGASDARRQQAEQQIAGQQAQYHDRATQQLQAGLAQQAQYQQNDERAFNQATAALRGNGLSNLFGGLSDVASAGAYEYTNRNGPVPAAGSGTGTYPPPYTTADDESYYPYPGRRRMTNVLAH